MRNRCQVVGILNVTPDSFSDGGLYQDVESAVQRASKIKEEGADILDIGAESTRPGSEGIDEKTERKRLFPIMRKLKELKFSLPISLDTSKPEIAEEALSDGLVSMINDVEGLRNPKMADVVRKWNVPVVIMHMFGSPRTMQNDFHYDDVVKDISKFFRGRIQEGGLKKEQIILDPGIGFGKSVEHNLEILRRLSEFRELGYPLFVGASRKSFIGKVLQSPDPVNRLAGSLTCAILAALGGASFVRVHDVLQTVEALRMVEALSPA